MLWLNASSVNANCKLKRMTMYLQLSLHDRHNEFALFCRARTNIFRDYNYKNVERSEREKEPFLQKSQLLKLLPVCIRGSEFRIPTDCE